MTNNIYQITPTEFRKSVFRQGKIVSQLVMTKKAPLKEKTQSSVILNTRDIDRINRYIIDNSRFVPYDVKSSAKWQADSNKVLLSLGIGR